MITAEPAEMFNKRNMMKLSGGSMDKQMLTAAFNRLKKDLDVIMKESGETVKEANVQYYLYER